MMKQSGLAMVQEVGDGARSRCRNRMNPKRDHEDAYGGYGEGMEESSRITAQNAQETVMTIVGSKSII